ncbi:MAG: cytosine deaminase [Microcoleus sp. SIO2G3]|nr:cytosine deaminase [Microcoleus sp. SIO2G3]
MSFPVASPLWLKNAHVPRSLLPNRPWPDPDPFAARDHLVLVDLEIADGVIRSIEPSAPTTTGIDLKRGIIFPCFADLHTHLDKGHSWGRSPNLSGSFEEALARVRADSSKYWNGEDVYRRMEFSLKCAYAHGTQAIRTHIDSYGEQAAISLGALKSLQKEWRDRLAIQAVTLVTLDCFQAAEGEKLADLFAEFDGGILGGLPQMSNQLEAQLDRVFTLAKDRNLDLDFHVDESGDPSEMTLRLVAEATIRHGYEGRVVCGHCCSLAVQSHEEAQKTIDLVQQAGIGIVSLPMCNLYLQDRNQQASDRFTQKGEKLYRSNFPTHTPRWRGVTLIHEFKHSGVPVAVASDNCRDPFHAFGDLDGLEVLTQATRIAQLESPYGDWCRAITMTPADLMKLPSVGRIAPGLDANLILFKARYFSELFSRPQFDRVVLRNGEAIDTTLPDYTELDDLLTVE